MIRADGVLKRSLIPVARPVRPPSADASRSFRRRFRPPGSGILQFESAYL